MNSSSWNRPMYLTNFHQEDCRILQLVKYTEMTSTTLTTSIMHMHFLSIRPHHLLTTIPQEKKLISIGPMYFTSFHQEDCMLLQILRYIGMTSTTLSTCTIHTKSGAIDKHMREEHDMLL